MLAKIRSFSLRNVTTSFAYKQGPRQALENFLHLQIPTLERNKRNFTPSAQRMLRNNDVLVNISLKLQIMKVICGDFRLSPPSQTGSPDAFAAVNKQRSLKAAISGAALKPPWGAMLVCSSSLCIQNQLLLIVSLAVNGYIHKYAKICFL